MLILLLILLTEGQETEEKHRREVSTRPCPQFTRHCSHVSRRETNGDLQLMMTMMLVVSGGGGVQLFVRGVSIRFAVLLLLFMYVIEKIY